jgi:UDP-galactopyranose mutase
MAQDYDHIVWTGKLDQWFDYRLGRLNYRTLRFEKYYGEGDFQGNAVINYGDESVPYTRISEHKHFTPWEEHQNTIYFKEYSALSRDDDIPYYPIRLADDKTILSGYQELASKEKSDICWTTRYISLYGYGCHYQRSIADFKTAFN